jgi:flagellar M-ring protein FliF
MSGLINRLRDWWLGADRTQKTVSIFGTAFLVALLGFTVYFAGRPRFQPVFSGLSPADQGLVVDELNKLGMPVEFNSQGAVLVPADRVAEARMRLAMSDKLPAAGPQGMEILEGINSFSTPGQEREKIKAAKEGELARSISTLEGVRSALVHISFGKDSPFSEETIEPSAVVNITESTGSGLTAMQGKAIARLVQNAVPGLKAQNVSVVNSAGRLVFDGQEEASPENVATRKIEAEIAEAKRRESDLQRRLDLAFGPGNTVAMVQVKLDMDAISEERRETQLGDKKVAEQTKESMSGSTPNPTGGVAGLDANSPALAPAAGGSGDTGTRYQSETVSNKYPTTESIQQIRRAAGELTGMTLTVIANSDVIKDPAPIQSILDGYLGSYDEQPGFTASVQSVPFDTSASKAQEKAAAAAAGTQMTQQIVSLLPVAALLMVGFMVSKAISKMPGRHLTMALPTGGTVRVPAGTAPNLDTPEAPGLRTVQDLAKTEPEVAEALTAMGVDTIDDTVDVEAIRQRIDIPLEQIKKLAKDKPQMIAALLKSWIMEERR